MRRKTNEKKQTSDEGLSASAVTQSTDVKPCNVDDNNHDEKFNQLRGEIFTFDCCVCPSDTITS